MFSRFHTLLSLLATVLLAACGGGGNSPANTNNPATISPVEIGTPLGGTVESRSDVDTARVGITQPGTLTITTDGPANRSVRVKDAGGDVIPGTIGSYSILITSEIIAKGDYIVIEFYGGKVGMNYTATTTFNSNQTSPITPDITGSNVSTPDAGMYLANGAEMPVRIVGVRQADEEGTIQLVDNIDFSIRRNSAGQFVLTLNGREHTFTEAELHRYGGSHDEADNAPPYQQGIWFSYQSGDFSELDSGNSDGDHYLAMRIGKEIVELPGSDPELETFAIIGFPTADFSSMGGRTAIWDSGFALIDVWPAEFQPGNNGQDLRERYETREVSLTADFSRSTISGHFNGFTNEDHPDTGKFSISIPETIFSNTRGFSGTLEIEGLDDAIGTYYGTFYGPNAEQVAGTFEGEVNQWSPPHSPIVDGSGVMIGWFGTDHQ